MFQLEKMFKLIILLVTLSCQCSSSPSTQVIIRSSNTVANNIFKVLQKEHGNVLHCPVSSNILLAMLSLAAKGKTSEELKTGLHLGSDEEIKNGYKNLFHLLRYYKLKLATRIYVKLGVSLNNDYFTTARRYFHTHIQKLDFNKPRLAAKIINTFVELRTSHKIHDVVNASSLDSNTSLVLSNAAHFKGNWRYRFHHTFDSDFYNDRNESMSTEMMENIERYNFLESDYLGAKVLKIRLRNRRYSMAFILPTEINGLESVEAKLDFTNLDKIFANLTSRLVQVQIPKFNVEANVNLKSALEEIGIKLMFSEDADLSGTVTDTKLLVSQAQQKVYINVNEFGVETAAATVFVRVESTQPKRNPEETFIANHPFMFVIMRGSLILFQGKIKSLK